MRGFLSVNRYPALLPGNTAGIANDELSLGENNGRVGFGDAEAEAFL